VFFDPLSGDALPYQNKNDYSGFSVDSDHYLVS
jgi:hypothetical protein